MRKIIFILSVLLLTSLSVWAQDQVQDSIIRVRLQDYFQNYKNTFVKSKLDTVMIDYNRRIIDIAASESFTYQPFRQETVDSIYSQIKSLLPGPVRFFNVTLQCGGKMIEQLIPNYYRKRAKKDRNCLELDIDDKSAPWVDNRSLPYTVNRGLQGRYIGLWQSHGKYYLVNRREWGWQRPRLFCTTEDLFSQSFVLPYLIPMLEHAGATVITPRERDIQRNEVVVDNDAPRTSRFVEINSFRNKWANAKGTGFGYLERIEGNVNPFTIGTARAIYSEKKASKALTEWIPDIPESGEYAVYVSYKTLSNSVNDARYTVYHKGEATEFRINQQMGGSTWVYLGTFDFDKGVNEYDKVSLTNESDNDGVITADAVRFGGGMGNIVRGTLSGLPRYLEGARYSAQWAGMPENIYNQRNGTDDYADDINVRSLMMNYLSGGSAYNPNKEGLHVPVEMTMALHTDAGSTGDDTFVGTLGVYTTNFNDEKLNTGISRYASRDLCDIVLTEITNELDKRFGINWQRRAMWNRNYSESRLPAAPSTIIEMLSHQNFADMKLAHDPNFKFAVGRAIYKGILRFITSQHRQEYEVQPLPVSHFMIQYGKKKNTLNLSWKGEEDLIEPTASPRNYVVYQRVDSASFDNGTKVYDNHYSLTVKPGQIYSFYVTAVNRGGESFPSEILSAMRLKKDKKLRALVVNGFTRLSTPFVVDTPDSLGFDLDKDPGVAYHRNISLCGRQTVFNRHLFGKEGSGSLGYSGSEMEGKTVMGNTFDYPYIHGRAIQHVDKWSFVSCSRESFEEMIGANEELVSPKNIQQLADYRCIDVIMGLQKKDGAALVPYKTFTKRMQGVLHSYALAGGNIIVSGSYIGSDMLSDTNDKAFCANVLKYAYDQSICDGDSVTSVYGKRFSGNIVRCMNEKFYPVTHPETLLPLGDTLPVVRYGNDKIAAILYYGKDYSSCVMGFPFESINDACQRNILMDTLLHLFEKRK